VNQELIVLYWDIGRLIVERQQREGWGKGVIDRLAADVQQAFPGIEGFSATNISRMRKFCLVYSQADAISAQAVPKLPAPDSAQAVPNLASEGGLGPIKSEPGTAPEPLLQIPWGHNVELLYHRQGKAITNFERTLLAPQSDLAGQLLKDPYTFDFLGLADGVREHELEQGLIDHIQRFILELGKGFAFVGRQYPLEVGGEPFYLDLLHLRSFVVIDLKVQPFQPEFVGKLNFYTTAVDNLLRHATDQPTIGLLLCKERNRVIVEYALQSSARPLSVATYRLLPEEIKANLPSPEELEVQLATFDAAATIGRARRPKTKRSPEV
jgi:predicted nuclease of restriction endonuclease-like (RecB) superfamily